MNSKRTTISSLNHSQDSLTEIKGRIETLRDIGKVVFAMVRDRTGLVQITIDKEKYSGPNLQTNDLVSIYGNIQQSGVRSGIPGLEINVNNAEIISRAEQEYPIQILPKTTYNLEMALNNRAISLRNPKLQNIFKIQASIAEYFREFLKTQDFIEIFTPKIVSQGAESGSTLFELNYFEKKAYLAQSPQFYKQIMAGSGLERVFEIGQVYRAEKHKTSRHLNEYVSMDYEMAFIDSFHDIIDVETGLIKHILNKLEENYGDVIKSFGVSLPNFENVPRISLMTMRDMISSKYGKNWDGIDDIDPEGERLATKIVKEQFGCDAVFLTEYPVSVRPFYTMPSSDNPKLTNSFDLIMNGVEVTTGGQRIHNYEFLKQRMHEYNIPEKENEGYLMAFKYGMPPHGGLGMGLERLTAQILQLENIKEASLFPRDRKRITP
jgi:nondiscriminating aspartyl-tRNA synthetase